MHCNTTPGYDAAPAIEVEVEKQTNDGVGNPGEYEDLGKAVKGALPVFILILFLSFS